MKIGSAVRPGRVPEGQSKKSQSGNISPIWGEAPIAPIKTKICMVGSLSGIITCANFQVENFRGYDFTVCRNPIFLLLFAGALQPCSATALPVITLRPRE